MLDEEEFNNPENVFNACRIKFRKENRNGLGITDGEQYTVCRHCAEEINEITECMVSQNVTIYTDKRFPPIETFNINK